MGEEHNDEWNANEAKIARILADLKAAGVQTDNCSERVEEIPGMALWKTFTPLWSDV